MAAFNYNNPMKLGQLSKELEKLLSIDDFRDCDDSLNGLQVGDENAEVKKVAFAVDACLESFRRTVEEGADLLIVHHGLFWGSPIAVTGAHYERIKTLIDGKAGLFACHLPLDAHPVLGNNAQMTLKLGLKDVQPFGVYHGKKIGYMGVLEKEMTCDEIVKALGVRTNEHNCIIRAGKDRIRSVGIVSGGAAEDVDQAMEAGLDAYITGESSHQTYHPVLEGKINMFSLGHYETETFGVKAVMEYVKSHYGLDVCFVDIPTTL